MIRLLCTVVLIAGLSACAKKPEAPESGLAPATEQNALSRIKGRTVPAVERAVPRFLRVTGQLVGRHDAIVAADAVGKVLAAPIERGAEVEAGEVLVRLDDRQAVLAMGEAEASVAMAQSRLNLARNEQERNAPLAAKRAIADSDFQGLVTDTAAREAELAGATARRDMAAKTLADSIIKAPFSGVIAERMVEPGEYVKADSPIARLVDLGTLRLVVNVPETEVGKLAIGQEVEFTTGAFPDRTFTGTLRFLGAAVRESSRDLVIEAEVENKEGILRPGFFCDARIKLREEKAVAVPAEALRIEGNRRRVFVVGTGGILEERLVEVGESREGFIEISRGVSAGESLLLSPGPEAADGVAFSPES